MNHIIDASKASQLLSIPKDEITQGFGTVTLDLSKIPFFEPWIIARIKGILKFSRDNFHDVNIIRPIGDADQYCGRMGLYTDEIEYSYPKKKHDSDKFFELFEITSDRNDNLMENVEKVLGNCNVPFNYAGDLAGALVELADNIYFHSGPNRNCGLGYVHGQIYPTRKEINIAFSDIGCGFYESYRREGTLYGRNEGELILDSTKQNYSCLNKTQGRGARGVGLHIASEFVRSVGIDLRIFSGKYRLHVTEKEVDLKEFKYETQGAIVIMRVPLI